MRVILRQDIAKLGMRGEVVTVKDGYARNFLLPKNMAYIATSDNEKRIAREKRDAAAAVETAKAEARQLADRLSGISATVQVKADGETIYGSVGPEEIVAAIAGEHGLQVDASVVSMDEHIKKVGTHDVTFRLAEDVETSVKVWVLPEDGELPEAGKNSEPAEKSE